MTSHAWPAPVFLAPREAWRGDGTAWSLAAPGDRALPEETAVALTYDGVTHAVMMTTPHDLHDFAVGFTLTEGIAGAAAILGLEIVPLPLGIEVRMTLAEAAGDALLRRRRRMAGPVGCGLCGIDSLAEAMRTPPPIPGCADGPRIAPEALAHAMAALAPAQPLHAQTRAMHAAALWSPDTGLVTVREDVGRHNALDKLAGALARSGGLPAAATGAILLTSRVSVEMVQKAARLGAPVLAAVSAPTALALRTAEAAGITLIAVARADGFEVFTHPWRMDTRRLLQ